MASPCSGATRVPTTQHTGGKETVFWVSARQSLAEGCGGKVTGGHDLTGSVTLVAQVNALEKRKPRYLALPGERASR